MPSSPGSRLDIMQLQAGTVMGGTTLLSLPHQPCSVRRLSVGSSSRQRSKTSSGGTQSSPMTATLRCLGILLLACHSERSPGTAWGLETQPRAERRISIVMLTLRLRCFASLSMTNNRCLHCVALGGGGEDARNLRPGELIRQALAAGEQLADFGAAERQAVGVVVPAGFFA